MSSKIRCMKCMEQFEEQYTVCPFCGNRRSENEANPMHLSAGSVIGEKYLIGMSIGHGGFGITYVAYDLSLERKVAIKEYFPYGISSRTTENPKVIPLTGGQAKGNYEYGKQKFMQEAKTLAMFSSLDSIVSVQSYFEQNNTVYIVMEYLEGVDLSEYVARQGGKVSFEKTLALVIPVLNALETIHGRGMIHRDISPDNIFVTNEGKTKLLDFGTARFAMGEKNKSMSVILKPGYAPPEQYSSQGKQGPWTDVYSLAATIYRMVVGKTLLDSLDRQMGNDDEDLRRDLISVPYYQREALIKALSPKIGNRQQNIQILKQELFSPKVKDATQPMSEEQPMQPRPYKTKSKKTIGIAVAAVVSLAALLVAVIILATDLPSSSSANNWGQESQSDKEAAAIEEQFDEPENESSEQSGYGADKESSEQTEPIIAIYDSGLKQGLLSALNSMGEPAGADIYESDLEKLKTLTFLNLSGYGIVDISLLGEFINLNEVHLNDNNINNISVLGDLPNLKYVYLDDSTYNKNSQTIGNLLAYGCAVECDAVLNNTSGYLLEGSDSRYISRSELLGFSEWETRLARNEIYARYGYTFRTDSIQSYFEGTNWYVNNPNVGRDNSPILNSYESKNVDTIKAYEREKGWLD